MTLLRRMSFQSKLLVSFALIVLLTSLVGYLFINYSVGEAFSTFTVRSFTMQDRVLSGIIVGTYNRTGSFDAVIDSLEETEVNVPLLLVDPEGNVAYPRDWEATGHRLTEAEIAQGQAIRLPSGERWALVPYRVDPEQAEIERVFFRRIRRSLWLAGLAAAAIAVLLSIFLIRQVTDPLRRLDVAAQRIARGEFGERVDMASSDEIGRLAQSFDRMAESLDRSERSKRQMIADVSHELRTPLAAVRSALEGLRDGLVEATPETLAALHDKILLTTRLVRDLHQLTLADSGRLSIHPAPCSIDEILDPIAETIGVQMEDAGIRLEQRMDEGLPKVLADRQRIEQVLLNLLSNAMRHTPAGGTITVSAEVLPGEIEITVCDDGSGLSDADLEHAFDRFYRADEARTSDAGAGLGLPIAKAIVEAHGGAIRAENVPEGGACFRFTLPIEDAPS